MIGISEEDPLEKEMVTCSGILTWENLIDRRAWWATVHGLCPILAKDSHVI